jgi:hypothetical protein
VAISISVSVIASTIVATLLLRVVVERNFIGGVILIFLTSSVEPTVAKKFSA